MNKPILCLDFDGVLHWYRTGWQDGTIYDGPVPGALDFLERVVDAFDVVVYSSRSKTREGRDAMRSAIGQWLFDAGRDPVLVTYLDFSPEKPAAFLTIDDRAMCFTGTFPPVDTLLAFKPWNQP